MYGGTERFGADQRDSAGPAAQHPEEALDVQVGAQVPVGVEVGGAGAGGWRAAPGEAGEEGLDVLVGAGVAVAVEVGRAARVHDAQVVDVVVEVDPADVLAPGIAAEAG